MTYISRYMDEVVENHFKQAEKPTVAIIAGVVGCGKTTLVNDYLLRDGGFIKETFYVESLNLDDTKLRGEIAENVSYFVERAYDRSNKPLDKTLFFIDEVQKSEAVFDAIKYSWDKGLKFIISGSNPGYLNTKAKKRLQRRSRIYNLSPLSILEISKFKKIFSPISFSNHRELFIKILDKNFPELAKKFIAEIELPNIDSIEILCREFFSIGGLPEIWSKKNGNSIDVISSVVSRGFDPIMSDIADDIIAQVTSHIAQLNNEEFKVDTIKKKTGIKSRDEIYNLIQDLINSGYISYRTPLFYEADKKSYLFKMSYTDPGFVSYLSGELHPDESEEGGRIDGYIHKRMADILASDSFTELYDLKHYYKPYSITTGNKVNYLKGEVDLIVQQRPNKINKMLPIEVKRSFSKKSLDLKTITQLLNDERYLDFGIVFYGGQPRVKEIENDKKIVFWPFWLL